MGVELGTKVGIGLGLGVGLEGGFVDGSDVGLVGGLGIEMWIGSREVPDWGLVGSSRSVLFRPRCRVIRLGVVCLFGPRVLLFPMTHTQPVSKTIPVGGH